MDMIPTYPVRAVAGKMVTLAMQLCAGLAAASHRSLWSLGWSKLSWEEFPLGWFRLEGQG